MGKNSLRKKILIKGVTTTPDDYLCEDGELAAGMGMENTEGGTESAGSHAPRLVMKMQVPQTERVIFEHKVKPAYNWIVWNDSTHAIGYRVDNRPADGSAAPALAVTLLTAGTATLTSDTMPAVEAVGNTLIVRTTAGDKSELHYVLWKPDDTAYKYLGTHIPEISMKFGLGIDYIRDFNTPGDSCIPYQISGLPKELSLPNFSIDEDNQAIITSAVMASVNKAQSESMRKGYFVQPFLVRYAIKMYDGSTTMASAPVYMPVTEMKSHVSYPICVVDEVDSNDLRFHTEHVRSKLKYMVLDEDLTEAKKWSDIITGVEIYVSAPIYTYKPSEKIKSTYGTINTDDASDKTDWAGKKILSQPDRVFAYGMLDGESLRDALGYDDPEAVTERRKAYKGWNRHSMAIEDFKEISLNGNLFSLCGDDATYLSDTKYWGENTVTGAKYASIPMTPRIFMLMPEKSESEFMKEIAECSNFYKVSEISLDDLKKKSEFKSGTEYVLENVEITEGTISAISARPQMDDEYRSHDTIIGAVMKTYNARLNLADIERTLYNSFNPECWFMHYDDRNGSTDQTLTMTVRIKESMQTYVVRGTGTIKAGTGLEINNPFPYIYFPNTNAERVWLQIGTRFYGEFAMEEHTGLNGSVYYSGEMNYPPDWRVKSAAPAATSNNVITEPNKIYTSEAENPWRFVPTNINTVGSGKILGVGAVTTALSQGQHGSFPMYCFTSEGIYSLSVNQTGGWSTCQTVTRDVMLEKRPILLIDDAIVFVSDQGIMMLQGDKTVLITSAQKGKGKIRITMMPGLESLLRGGTLTDFSKLTASATDIDDAMGGELMQYIQSKDIDMYYDYTNQRIAVGREDKEYCWLYYLGKHQWTVAPWRLMNRVNTYPECYAMLRNAGSNYMVRLNTQITDEEKAYDTDLGLSDDMLLLTRPIKLQENADLLKELENMTVEGLFDKTKLGMAVWGTRNYKDWHLVGSCTGLHLVRKHGSGYRAFVVAIIGKLGQGEYMDSITMEYKPRYVQKLHGMGY